MIMSDDISSDAEILADVIDMINAGIAKDQETLDSMFASYDGRYADLARVTIAFAGLDEAELKKKIIEAIPSCR